jgi:hypothetical protein
MLRNSSILDTSRAIELLLPLPASRLIGVFANHQRRAAEANETHQLLRDDLFHLPKTDAPPKIGFFKAHLAHRVKIISEMSENIESVLFGRCLLFLIPETKSYGI